MMDNKERPHRIKLDLTDEEVEALTAFAIRGGVTVESLLKDLIKTTILRGHRHRESVEKVNKDIIYQESFTVDFYLLRGLHKGIHGVTMPGHKPSKYKIAINEKATETQKLATFLHEMTHIYNHDHDTGGDIREKEERTQRQLLDALELLKREVLESEPTERDDRSAAATPATVGTLERLEDETYNAYGVNSKPAGLKWVEMALDLAKRITKEPGLLEAITEADLDQLTEENFHTARHAAEVAQYLKRYII